MSQHQFFFIHIEKTAGTSFKKMLNRQFKEEKIYANLEDQKLNGWKYPAFEKYLFLAERKLNAIELLVGHIPFCLGNILPKEVKYLVFLRHPVNRVVSHLQYVKRHLAHHHEIYKKYKNVPLAKIYDDIGRNLANLQVRYFADSEIKPPFYFFRKKRLDAAGVKAAKANLLKCDFIGITEAFSTSIKLAEKKFNWELGESLRTNITPNKTKEKVPDDLIARISEDNHQDIEFYFFAKHSFEFLLKLEGIQSLEEEPAVMSI